MKKRMIWKDIKKCFSKSKGRFISILCLIMLGSFALVGLKVTGPDMRRTGKDYFNCLNLADLTILGDYGIDEENQKAINEISGAKKIEYGYLKDVEIQGTTTSFRIFSAPEEVSVYEIIEGRMPEARKEIAIASIYNGEYKLGDTISFTEKADMAGDTVLKNHKFEIVGFINSGEILSSINMGQSTAGTGELNGYAVVTPSAFDSDVYMIARIKFADTDGVDPYSEEYTELIQKHKSALNDLLADQPEKRLASIQEEYQSEIKEGQDKIDDAKKEISDTERKLDDAKEQLIDADKEIVENQEKLDTKVSEAQTKINDGEAQIREAKASINEASSQLNSAADKLASGKATLEEKWALLQAAKDKLALAKTKLDNSEAQLKSAKEAIENGKQQMKEANSEIEEKEQQLADAQESIQAGDKELSEKKAEINGKQQEYDVAAAQLKETQQELAGAQQQLTQKQAEIDSNRSQLESGKATYESGITKAQQGIDALTNSLNQSGLIEEERVQLQQQLTAAQESFATIQVEYEAFLSGTYTPGIAALDAGQQEVNQKSSEVEAAAQELSEKETELAGAKAQLDAGNAQISEASAELEASKQQVSEGQVQIDEAKKTLKENKKLLAQKEAEYNEGEQQYNAGLDSYNAKLKEYDSGLNQWKSSAETLQQKQAEYEENVSRLKQAKDELVEKETELAKAKVELDTQQAEGEQKLAAARNELADKQSEYEEKNAEFQDKKAEAEEEIAQAEEDLKEAQDKVDSLELPAYAVDTRREVPGSEGYTIYSSVSEIIDSLANVFPIFLYFVAALVTLTTMTRFVDEERTNSGTLKALGYTDEDVMRKFTIYGFISSIIGAVLGIIAGHTLLPLIVYHAYGDNFTLPKIELHFYPGITAVALVLALISAVIPARIVATRELAEKPSVLLLPKPPAAGSKIFLERIRPVWKHMSFTHKVTARNIFRYKKRMLMTIFGVAGAVTLLFAGFSVQHSISGVNERQYGEIIQYDLIVAKNSNLDEEQEAEIDNLLKSGEVDQQMPVYYETLTRVAGDNQDKQEITLIVPENKEEFKEYIKLVERKSQNQLELEDDGVIISERLAKLLDAKVGDTITVYGSSDQEREVKVSGVTEMYMGHFIFMNSKYYEDIFSEDYDSNASLVTLADRSIENANKQAQRFMKLDGVEGVVQNTTMINQIDTIVDSLNMIMDVLIIVAVLLAVVILYNLTNINVAERIRELSTIKVLGFFDKEVTMYIYRETILLTILGILAGFGLGDALYQYILAVVPPDEVMFNPALGAKAFLVPTIAVSIITVALGIFINRKLRDVDMMEALKSVE